MKSSKSRSIIISLLLYVIAIAIATLVFQSLDQWHWIARIGLADLAATLFVYLCSVLLNNSSMYDPYWSVKPMAIAFAALFTIGIENAQWFHWLTFGLMQLYGLRLTTNFYRDWPGFIHEDWRYVNFREQFGKAYWLISFLAVHLFPTLMVLLSCLPIYAIFVSNHVAYPIVVLIGAAILLCSILLAFFADEQMRTFRTNKANKGKYMNEKLWKHSRHPNYLGEILTWWGLFIIALGVSPLFWWTGLGALAINLMFVFASIPMLDKRSMERRAGFETCMEQTNMLLPIPKS